MSPVRNLSIIPSRDRHIIFIRDGQGWWQVSAASQIVKPKNDENLAVRSAVATEPAQTSSSPLETGATAPESSNPASGGAEGTPGLVTLQAVLKHLPEGVAVLDKSLVVRWCNDKFLELCGRETALGLNFHEAFGAPEFLGPDFAPFHTALAHGDTVRCTFRLSERFYFEVQASPVREGDAYPELLVTTVRDISAEVHQQQKLKAIYAAGMELGEISADDLLQLSVKDRIELLKQKIIKFTKDVLQFETMEIRLLDKATGQLEPLLNVGMTEEAANRKLVAAAEGNGVTGFVAAGGGSYLCEDTSLDSRYLTGAPNARSSLTVPLMIHDEILGTFNVESERPGAFTRQDLQFLELFGREVALAINTLELLAVEKLTATTKSTELILRQVARPVDEILNCTTWILDRYIGHDPAVCERLQTVQKQTRDIKLLIQRVGDTIAPDAAHPAVPVRAMHPKLRHKRILVVDNDEAVRDHAHAALGQIGCEVETAHNGEEALLMARTFHYDAVIADIRLPDMNGYDCFVQLRNINEHLPVILMTGYGWDPGHSIVKARQAGLKSALYKPFRLDQLLTELERAMSADAPPAASGNG